MGISLPGLGNVIGRVLTELPKLLYERVWKLLQVLATATLGPLMVLNNGIPTFIANFGPVQEWLEVAECWFPVAYFLTGLQIYMAFLATFITIKFILKMIPFLG